MTHITAAAPAEWPAALELLQGGVDAQTRQFQARNALTLLASGEIDPAGLLVARAGDEIRGVQLAVSMAGSSGLVWPPQVLHPSDLELEDCLAQAGLEYLRHCRVQVAHAILSDEFQAGALLRAGLAPMTHLLYLHHDLDYLPDWTVPHWQLLPFDPDDPELFQETLLRTYERTMDCPELNGTRNVEEIVAGHQAQGVFRPERWRLALRDGAAIGVVLLNPLRDAPDWDLSYVGVAPEQRGRGWGRSLIHWALRAAREGGAGTLQVAVDERNLPALTLYRSLRFVETGRRLVLWRVLTSS